MTQRINVYDKDETTVSGSVSNSVDVAFVPGFTVKTSPALTQSTPVDTATHYTATPSGHTDWVAGVKMLCTADYRIYQFTLNGTIAGFGTTNVASASAPSSPSANQYWYDTQNSKLKKYSSSTWTDVTDTDLVEYVSDYSFVSGDANKYTLRNGGCYVISSVVAGYTWQYVEDSVFGKPYKCTSISEFHNTFGNAPLMVIANTFTTEDGVPTGAIQWIDRNFIYAEELLNAGLPVWYYALPLDSQTATSFVQGDMDGTFAASGYETSGPRKCFMDNFVDMYATLADKNTYDVKYITTGCFGLDFGTNITVDADALQYPFYNGSAVTTNTMHYLVDIANYRGDALALLDPIRKYCFESFVPATSTSAYYKFDALVKAGLYNTTTTGMTEDDKAKAGRKAANTFPWGVFTCSTMDAYKTKLTSKNTRFSLPGSFAYLLTLAVALQKGDDASWSAIMGVTRAIVPNLVDIETSQRVTMALADVYTQDNATGINAIAAINTYGYCIWGNRTLNNNYYFAQQGDGTYGLVASSFVDIMSMTCNINKYAYNACVSIKGEKDNDVTWIKFVNKITPYLNKLKLAGALNAFRIVRVSTTAKGKLVAKIIVYPTYSLESFDIEIAIRDAE